MGNSASRILTTHTGSLPRPEDLADLMLRYNNEREETEPGFWDRVAAATAEAVRRQTAIGLDIVSDGEFGKASYAGYVKERLTGFDGPLRGGRGGNVAADDAVQSFPLAGKSERHNLVVNPNMMREREEFPDFVRTTVPSVRYPSNSGLVAVRDHAGVQRDIANLKDALAGQPATDAFMPAASPGIISAFMPTTYYENDEAYLVALAEAMQPEYKAIVDAGFVLQIDCPDLVKTSDARYGDLSLDQFRKAAEMHVEVLNHALEGLPRERLRMHLCWGNYEGPHNHDLPLEDILDVAFKAHVGGLCIEAANPRHAHEWRAFEELKPPDGMRVIPGVIDTCTNYIEHPALVAERIVRFADVLGRENVIAGTDCGFGTSLGRRHVAASIAWAKLESLVEGAKLASDELWK